MPMDTNGVYQDHSVPNLKNCGVGSNVAYPVNRPEGMGPKQYSPPAPGYVHTTPSSHDKLGNSTYCK